MSPLTVFIRTLAKSTAIFLGAGLIFLNPSLEVRGLSELKRLSTGGSIGGLGVTAQKSCRAGRRAHRRAEGHGCGRAAPGRSHARRDAQRTGRARMDGP